MDTVRLRDEAELIGYCISTMEGDSLGEVESLFVEEQHRDRGLGMELLQRSLDWNQDSGAERIIVGVIAGNERALSFDQRFGLLPRTTILEQPPR